jgi:outer membrane lipoprotein-sorting protein
MLRLRGVALAACALALGSFFVQAQEIDVKAVVRKAVEAHGGEKELSKFHAGTAKYKGTMHIVNQIADITAENSFQKPDKFRSAMTLMIAGQNVEVITVFDGKKFWVSAAGNTMEVNDEKLIAEVRESLLIEGGGLVDILKDSYELAAIGEVKVKDQDTIGIRVSKKGQRDVSYYFDKKTHLVAKIEMRATDQATKQEVNQEKYIVEYQDKGGLKVAKHVVILNDGNPFMDIEITEIQVHEKLDDSLFMRP